jgi:hypothetical protein
VDARLEKPATERLVVEALPKLVCPVTVRAPLDVKDDVAVIEPPVITPLVNVEKNPVTAVSNVEKRLVEVLLVITLFTPPILVE